MWGSPSYMRVVEAKRLERAKLVSKAPAYIAVEHENYLKASASTIVSHIQSGEWKASAVVEAYIAQAALAHAATNCLTEILFEQARKEAAELDVAFTATGKIRGPLHGVPISMKDQFYVAEIDTTVGFTQKANNPSRQEAEGDIVRLMRAAGAIIIAKTNIPQTMLGFECNNPLWGRTTNPYNSAFSSGGSSGGEAALISIGGSVIGWGSDIGGSIRIPSGYCGIYGFKPGYGRIAFTGKLSLVPGYEGVKAVAGPMCRSVDDIELACRTVMGITGNDLQTPPLGYRDVKLAKKLRFGFYTSDDFIESSPACRRAVLETVDALRRDGHECIEFEVPSVSRAFGLFVSLTSSDGYKTLLSHISSDPRDPSLFLLTWTPRLPRVIRVVAAWIIRKIIGDPQFAALTLQSRAKPVEKYWKVTAQRDEYIDEFYTNVWKKFEFDGIISPVQAIPGMPNGRSAPVVGLSAATILHNVLDQPVGVVPVTRVDPVKDALTARWNNLQTGSFINQSTVYSGKKPIYDANLMKGLPVAIQIVGRKWEDEKVIAMMHVVDKALGERGFGSMARNSII